MDPDHDRAPTPDESLRQVARILAGAVLRLRARAALPTASAEVPAMRVLPENAANSLDVPATRMILGRMNSVMVVMVGFAHAGRMPVTCPHFLY
jgi:hypothetical protein